MRTIPTTLHVLVWLCATVSVVHAQSAGDYRTVASGDWSDPATWERHDGFSWQAALTAPATTDGVITILNGHQVTLTANTTINETIVETGGSIVTDGNNLLVEKEASVDLLLYGTLFMTGAGPTLNIRSDAAVEVHGSIINSSTGSGDNFTYQNSNSSLLFKDGSLFQHDRNGGGLPNQSHTTWEPTSTCEITGITTNQVGNRNHTFGHFVWNCPNQSSSKNLAGNPPAVLGDFRVLATGSTYLSYRQSLSGGFSVGGDLVVEGGIFYVNDGGGDVPITVAGDYIQTGGILRTTDGNTSFPQLFIAGDFNQTAGDIDQVTGSNSGIGTIIFNGGGAQTITALGTKSGKVDFKVDKTSGTLTLLSDLTLPRNLILENGILTLGSFHLTMSNPAADINAGINSFDNTRMIDASGSGEVRKVFAGTGSFFFPVGDQTSGDDYSPVTLNFTGGTFASNAYAAVRVTDAVHPDLNPSSHYITRYWTVTSSGISDVACITSFVYVDGDIVGDEGEMGLGKWDGFWDIIGNVNTGTNTLSGLADGFSDFTGGNPDALPVELVSFSARLASGMVKLSWTTATEMNNYGFTVLRSEDGTRWEERAFILGHGTTSSPRTYSHTDEIPASSRSGILYYKLEQLDRDGKSHEYGPIQVRLATAPARATLDQNYPNPFNPTTTIPFTLPSASTVRLVLYSLSGKEIRPLLHGEFPAGQHHVPLDAGDLPSGFYLYAIETPFGSERRVMHVTR